MRGEGIPELASQDDMDYADDATVLIENDNREQMCARLGKYAIIKETRELKIQWGKVSLLTSRQS